MQFGRKSIRRLPELVAGFGKTALLVTGKRSFVESVEWPVLLKSLFHLGVTWGHVSIDKEPSPRRVDEIMAQHRETGIDVVVGISGSSTLDAAKAVAGLLRIGFSVMDHLEGVGKGLPYIGSPVPTTAGTGSEETKNTVLSQQGPGGFKKSLRDERLVLAIALVDPDLLASCPKPQIAANGIDAFTQLLESYVSVSPGVSGQETRNIKPASWRYTRRSCALRL